MIDTSPIPTVFTAQSKRYFYCRDAICAFVLRRSKIPLNPFRIFDYFLNERAERDMIRRSNHNLIRISDEFWVFGALADGVLQELAYASSLHKPVRFFSISARDDEILEIQQEQVTLEPELLATNSIEHLKETFCALGLDQIQTAQPVFRWDVSLPSDKQDKSSLLADLARQED